MPLMARKDALAPKLRLPSSSHADFFFSDRTCSADGGARMAPGAPATGADWGVAAEGVELAVAADDGVAAPCREGQEDAVETSAPATGEERASPEEKGHMVEPAVRIAQQREDVRLGS